MNDPIFDARAQAAKSSLDDALAVAQRVQQRLGVLAQPGGPPAPGQPPQTPQQKPQTPAQPATTPAVWPQMPGVNPLLQQLASQYQQQQTPQYAPQPQAPGNLAVHG